MSLEDLGFQRLTRSAHDATGAEDSISHALVVAAGALGILACGAGYLWASRRLDEPGDAPRTLAKLTNFAGEERARLRGDRLDRAAKALEDHRQEQADQRRRLMADLEDFPAAKLVDDPLKSAAVVPILGREPVEVRLFGVASYDAKFPGIRQKTYDTLQDLEMDIGLYRKGGAEAVQAVYDKELERLQAEGRARYARKLDEDLEEYGEPVSQPAQVSMFGAKTADEKIATALQDFRRLHPNSTLDVQETELTPKGNLSMRYGSSDPDGDYNVYRNLYGFDSAGRLVRRAETSDY